MSNINDLQKGAGGKGALKRKGYFERRPHPLENGWQPNETSRDWAICRAVDLYRAPRNKGDERTLSDFLADAGLRILAEAKRANERHQYVPHPEHPQFCERCGYAESERLKHTPLSPDLKASQRPTVSSETT